MQITQNSAEGLKREFTIVVSASDIEKNVEGRLKEIGGQVKIPGFRPGKVPMNILKDRYGANVMGEVLEKTVQESSMKAMSDENLRPAMQPKIEVKSFDEGKDLEYTMSLEVLPEIELKDFSGLSLERKVAEAGEKEVDEMLAKMAEAQKDYQPVKRKRKSREGDQIVINFDGRVDGEARDGMKGEGYPLVLGSGSFIPGFEEQVVGMKPGETLTITVTFPETYHAEELAGKEAEFDVEATELREAVDAEVNDDFAKKFGAADLEDLKKQTKERIESEYSQLARMHLKRELLDLLAEQYEFDVPEAMKEQEFNAIWQRFEEEKKAGNLSEEEAAKDDEEVKAEYHTIAERRVRLGLVLSEVGTANKLTVSDDELRRAMITEAQRYPGQERQVLEFFQKNPRALDGLRAPIFEDKVVDFILELAKVEDKTVSAEELMADPQED